jgi:hypothetical protein
VEYILGVGREEGSECDVIGTRLARLHREVTAVVASDADLGGGSEQPPRFARIAVSLTEMDTVGAAGFRQVHSVVEDERNIGAPADRHQPFGRAEDLLVGSVLHSELERRHGSRPYCRAKLIVEMLVQAGRRDEVELAGASPCSLEPGGEFRIEPEIVFIFHQRRSSFTQ